MEIRVVLHGGRELESVCVRADAFEDIEFSNLLVI